MCFVIIMLKSLIKGGAINAKGKHIDVNYHYVRHMIERREIKIDYIHSEKMIADPMTNGLSLETFTIHVENMGLRCTS